MSVNTWQSVNVWGAQVGDTTPPVVTISPPQTTYNILVGGTFTPPVGTWTDDTDGTGAVTPQGSVNTNIVGTYILTYSYTDQAGNQSNVITVTVNINGNVDVIPSLSRDTWNDISDYLRGQGFAGSNNDVMREWLRGQGYTGTLNDMWNRYLIEAVGAGSLPDNLARWRNG